MRPMIVQYYSTQNKKLVNLLEVPSNFGGFSKVTYYLKPGVFELEAENR